MSGSRFTLDTNILIYAVDGAAGVKHRLAFAIVDQAAECDCVLTLQALGEFYHATTRKGGLDRRRAVSQITDWIVQFPTAAANESALQAALVAASSGKFGFWDALMLATADEAGCSVLVSEDMHDGACMGGVTVQSPFARGALTASVRQLIGL